MARLGWLVVGTTACGGGSAWFGLGGEGPPADDPAWTEDPGADEDWRTPGVHDAPSVPARCGLVDPALLRVCEGQAAVVRRQSYDTVQDAIDAAEPPETVYVCPGRWRGPLVVDDGPVALRAIDANPRQTIITGGGDDTVLVVAEADVLVHGFTLRDGYATRGGAAIDAQNSTVRIRCTEIVDNEAAEDGVGGINAESTRLYVHSSSFRDNAVASPRGIRDIRLNSEQSHPMALVVEHTTFSSPSEGVAIRYRAGTDDPTFGELVVRDSQLTGAGVGVSLYGNLALDARIEGTRFAGHRLDPTFVGSTGAAVSMDVRQHLTLSVRGSTFRGNASAYDAAALAVKSHRGEVAVTVEDSEFVENTSSSGGAALVVTGGPSVSVAIDGASFEDNQAREAGAIKIVADASTIAIRDSRLVGNQAEMASALLVLGDTELASSGLVLHANVASEIDAAAIELPARAGVAIEDSDFGTGDADNVPHDLQLGGEAVDGGEGFTLQRR